MVGIDIQSLFADIIQSPGQRRQSLTAQGERDAVTATRGLTGGAQLAAPLIAQLAASSGMRDEMLQRSVGGLFGLDTRNESEKLQGALKGADISTEAGQNALLEQVEDVSPAHAAKLRQEFSEGRLAQQKLQENAAANNTLVDTSTLDATKQASVRRIIAANPSMEPDKVVTIIKNMGGMPKEETAPTFTYRSARITGEDGIQTVRTSNRGDGGVFKEVMDEDGNITLKRLPSTAVEFVTSTETKDVTPPTLPTARPTEPGQGRPTVYDYIKEGTGISSALFGTINESPLGDMLGRPEVAEAQAFLNSVQNLVLTLYTSRREGRPSNWSESLLLKLLPKVGSPWESDASAEAKYMELQRRVVDQIDFERREFDAAEGNPTKQADHREALVDLQRILENFEDGSGNLPDTSGVPSIATSRGEVRNFPAGTQYFIDGYRAVLTAVTTEDDIEKLPSGTPFFWKDEDTPRIRN